MKKRLHKKLHKGEYQEFGISLFVPSNGDSINEKLDTITHIADDNKILFIGGGFGYFTMPSEEYGNMDIPKKIETLTNYIALSNEPQPDGIIGYFIKPFEKEISNEIAQKVKSELETAIGRELKINLSVDLWN